MWVKLTLFFWVLACVKWLWGGRGWPWRCGTFCRLCRGAGGVTHVAHGKPFLVLSFSLFCNILWGYIFSLVIYLSGSPVIVRNAQAKNKNMRCQTNRALLGNTGSDIRELPRHFPQVWFCLLLEIISRKDTHKCDFYSLLAIEKYIRLWNCLFNDSLFWVNENSQCLFLLFFF